MVATPSGADVLANTLLTSLTAGVDFTVPEVDTSGLTFGQPSTTGPLYGAIEKVEITDLTTGAVNGNGVFDKLMSSLVAHLKVEYQANRISGAEYTRAYIGIVGAALQTAQQFLLGRDQAYWGTLLVQAQAKAADIAAVTARLELETVRVLLARNQFEAATAEVNYGLTKMKIATEDISYANMVTQGLGLGIQNDNLTKQGAGLEFTNTQLLPKQANLLLEQIEVQRAQTMNTRSDGSTLITGSVGKQKELYSQQIDSYKRDAETKVAKIFSDAWITQKTIDEGLVPPPQFNNTNVDAVLTKIRTANGLT